MAGIIIAPRIDRFGQGTKHTTHFDGAANRWLRCLQGGFQAGGDAHPFGPLLGGKAFDGQHLDRQPFALAAAVTDRFQNPSQGHGGLLGDHRRLQTLGLQLGGGQTKGHDKQSRAQ